MAKITLFVTGLILGIGFNHRSSHALPPDTTAVTILRLKSFLNSTGITSNPLLGLIEGVALQRRTGLSISPGQWTQFVLTAPSPSSADLIEPPIDWLSELNGSFHRTNDRPLHAFSLLLQETAKIEYWSRHPERLTSLDRFQLAKQKRDLREALIELQAYSYLVPEQLIEYYSRAPAFADITLEFELDNDIPGFYEEFDRSMTGMVVLNDASLEEIRTEAALQLAEEVVRQGIVYMKKILN